MPTKRKRTYKPKGVGDKTQYVIRSTRHTVTTGDSAAHAAKLARERRKRRGGYSLADVYH